MHSITSVWRAATMKMMINGLLDIIMCGVDNEFTAFSQLPILQIF